MVRLRGIARSGADAGDRFRRNRSSLLRFSSGGVAPEFLADALVHALGQGLGEAVGQRFHEDRRCSRHSARSNRSAMATLLDAGSDDEAAEIVRLAAV
jgi:hypothetical protein